MKIKFNKVILHNFLSFEDAELSLDNKGFVSIKGINENPDDLALSNGSGKSSLFEAINWCICGETIRGTKDVTRLGTDGCFVELYFECDNNKYKLIRYKDPSNLKIFINDVDKSGKGVRDTEKLLTEYLPDLTDYLIGSVIILGQGLPSRFTNNTPAGRKEVLEKLSKSDFMIKDLATRISDRKQLLNKQLRDNEDTALKLNTEIEVNNRLIIDNQDKLINLIKPDAKELERLELELSDATSDRLEAEKEKENLQKELAGVNDYILTLTNSHQSDLTIINQSYVLTTKDLKNKLNDLTISKEAKIVELTKLKSITDICPTCGQKIPGAKKPSTTNLESEITSIEDSISSIKKELDVFDDENDTLIREHNLDYEKSMNEFKSQKIEINKELVNIDVDSFKQRENKLSQELSAQKTLISNYDTTVRTLKESIENAKNDIEETNSKLLYINNEHSSMSDRLDIVTKMSNLITRDFRGFLLINVINFIDKKAKEYSLDIFNTDKIEFKLDGNNIDILYDSKEYNCLSGGEKQKVDIIIQFAIRDMLCTYLNFSSNVLVLDEISDNIDAVGAEKLFNMISTKLRDVESIFIISHHQDFQLPIDTELIIKKGSDKISRLY